MTLRSSNWQRWRQLLAGWLLPALLLTGALSGCSLSFTGAALDPSIKTYSIENFPNASQGPASLSQNFTEDLRDYVQRNSNLKLDPSGGGDVQFSGAITGFTVTPAGVSAQGGQETAGANRLTITVQVRYVNSKDEKASFEQAFTAYEDFEQSRTVASLDDAFLRTITNRLLIDIFARSLANW